MLTLQYKRRGAELRMVLNGEMRTSGRVDLLLLRAVAPAVGPKSSLLAQLHPCLSWRDAKGSTCAMHEPVN